MGIKVPGKHVAKRLARRTAKKAETRAGRIPKAVAALREGRKQH